jgi:hypothetical protein
MTIREQLVEALMLLTVIVLGGIFTFTVGDWWALPAGVLQ